MDTDEDELGPWWCWRCRAEKTYPHAWCGTWGCECDECIPPASLAAVERELGRRWPGRVG